MGGEEVSDVMVRQEGCDLPIADNGILVHITPDMTTNEAIAPILSTESE